MAKHLVMAGRLLDDEPERALAHARAARAIAARIGVVREAVGLAAYAMQQWTEALAELRAARRITGRPDHLAVFADCERALGRPERALAYADDPAVPGLPQDERVELVIVLAGARADMGQVEAAVLTLQEPAQRTSARREWAGRLWYAYADALLRASRPEQAREWFARVAELDDGEATDAVDRLLEIDGVELTDLQDAEEDAQMDLPAQEHVDPELAEYIRRTYGASSGTPASQGGSDVEASRVVSGSMSHVGGDGRRADVDAPGAASVAAPGTVTPPVFNDGGLGADLAPGRGDGDGASPGPTAGGSQPDADRGEDGPLRLFE